jgi:hypothetical protein
MYLHVPKKDNSSKKEREIILNNISAKMIARTT